jgi:acetate kinase
VASFAAVPPGIGAVAHRIVHGGRFVEPVLIEPSIENELRALGELAPLHTHRALEVAAEARRLFPDIPHVAVFDTAFHATLPDEASTFAVPLRWREEWGIRRYGFHGLSVQWSSEQVRVPRLVVCHLGGGCSVTAVRDGRSVDTTMGFSPLDGVPMSTRSGTIDPEIIFHLLRNKRVELEELDRLLEEESGLLGVSGISGHVEVLETSTEPSAQLALTIFAHRVAAAIAAMTAALGGLDALVFTAGVGEHSPSVRADVCRRLGFLGVELDDARNQADTYGEIGFEGSAVRVVVVEAREDVIAARQARTVLS